MLKRPSTFGSANARKIRRMDSSTTAGGSPGAALRALSLDDDASTDDFFGSPEPESYPDDRPETNAKQNRSPERSQSDSSVASVKEEQKKLLEERMNILDKAARVCKQYGKHDGQFLGLWEQAKVLEDRINAMETDMKCDDRGAMPDPEVEMEEEEEENLIEL